MAKKKQTPKTFAFKLDPTKDRDLIRWLETHENTSAAIRSALRSAMRGDMVTLTDVYSEIRRISERLDKGVVFTGDASEKAGIQPDRPTSEEDTEDLVAGAAIDDLLGW